MPSHINSLFVSTVSIENGDFRDCFFLKYLELCMYSSQRIKYANHIKKKLLGKTGGRAANKNWDDSQMEPPQFYRLIIIDCVIWKPKRPGRRPQSTFCLAHPYGRIIRASDTNAFPFGSRPSTPYPCLSETASAHR